MLVPEATPASSTSPETLWTSALPLRREPTRTSPETDLTTNEPPTESAATLHRDALDGEIAGETRQARARASRVYLRVAGDDDEEPGRDRRRRR